MCRRPSWQKTNGIEVIKYFDTPPPTPVFPGRIKHRSAASLLLAFSFSFFFYCRHKSVPSLTGVMWALNCLHLALFRHYAALTRVWQTCASTSNSPLPVFPSPLTRATCTSWLRRSLSWDPEASEGPPSWLCMRLLCRCDILLTPQGTFRTGRNTASGGQKGCSRREHLSLLSELRKTEGERKRERNHKRCEWIKIKWQKRL